MNCMAKYCMVLLLSISVGMTSSTWCMLSDQKRGNKSSSIGHIDELVLAAAIASQGFEVLFQDVKDFSFQMDHAENLLVKVVKTNSSMYEKSEPYPYDVNVRCKKSDCSELSSKVFRVMESKGPKNEYQLHKLDICTIGQYVWKDDGEDEVLCTASFWNKIALQEMLQKLRK
jgi:hypothetical protein